MLARRRSESPVVNILGISFYVSVVMFKLLLVGGFIMYYIIPKYKVIFEGFDAKLPALTERVISISNIGVNFWYLFILGNSSGAGRCLDGDGICAGLARPGTGVG